MIPRGINVFDMMAIAMYISIIPFFLISDTPRQLLILMMSIGILMHIFGRLYLATEGPVKHVSGMAVAVALVGYFDFIAHFLGQIHLTIGEGANEYGFFAWTLMDLGLIHVEPAWYFIWFTGVVAGIPAYIIYYSVKNFIGVTPSLLVAAFIGGLAKSVSYGFYDTGSESIWEIQYDFIDLTLTTADPIPLIIVFTIVHGAIVIPALLILEFTKDI